MNYGVIGLGQAGSTVSDLWALTNKNVACINTSKNDSELIKNVKNKYVVLDGKNGGMAKQRDYILDVIKEDQAGIIEFLTNFISSNKIDKIIFISSTAGGTGSGLISQLNRIFCNRIKIRNIIITPDFTECRNSFENTINTIMELQQYEVSVRIISNQNYSKDSNVVKKYNDINKYIVDTEQKIFDSGENKSFAENIDNAEVEKLMFSSGFSPVYRVIDDKNDLNNKMFEKIKNSLDVKISEDKAICSMGLIAYSTIDNFSRINEKDLEEKIGIPKSRFRAVINPKNGEKNEFILVLAGCSMPDYIKEYSEKLKFMDENIKNRKPLVLEIQKKDNEEFNFKIEKEAEKKDFKKNNDNWLQELSF
ncbi:MAG: hypothetical protein ACRCZ0_12555 [Cetobacterium sp.]